MANPEHVDIVKQGRKAIIKWRKNHRKGRLELDGADQFAIRVNIQFQAVHRECGAQSEGKPWTKIAPY